MLNPRRSRRSRRLGRRIGKRSSCASCPWWIAQSGFAANALTAVRYAAEQSRQVVGQGPEHERPITKQEKVVARKHAQVKGTARLLLPGFEVFARDFIILQA